MAAVAYPSAPHTVSMSEPASAALPFAFAQIKGAVCLVQLTDPSGSSSPLMYSDVRVFRHEFITIFRYSHCTSVHPSDFQVLELLDGCCTAYEEDKGTVCLAREVMARMQRLASVGGGATAPHHAISHIPGSRSSRVARIH
ncbi:hypothetical protein EUX98_g4469 [Antrodiella citrinella]|uniref:Uncharacterized protein n=1 Tax=Antrodiella citrinella TaxID=2447956 RepID=A0A4S4MWC5_9APHY|nr:hypothetical protein EUX98_g4469 [Antrodiella citrinella]